MWCMPPRHRPAPHRGREQSTPPRWLFLSSRLPITIRVNPPQTGRHQRTAAQVVIPPSSGLGRFVYSPRSLPEPARADPTGGSEDVPPADGLVSRHCIRVRRGTDVLTGAGGDRNPVVARDDRRRTATSSSSSPTISTRARATTRSSRTYKGGYADTMNAGIAAFRAGNAPHIMQVFEVGTATMMAAKGAVKPVYQLMKEAGENLRSEGLSAGDHRLLLDGEGRDAVLPVQFLVRWCSGSTRTRSTRPASIPQARRPGRKCSTPPRSCTRRSPTCGLLHRLADLGR